MKLKNKQTNRKAEVATVFFVLFLPLRTCYACWDQASKTCQSKCVKVLTIFSVLPFWMALQVYKFARLCKEKKKSSTNLGHVWCQIQRKIIKESSGSKRSAIFLIMRSLAETSHNLNSSQLLRMEMQPVKLENFWCLCCLKKCPKSHAQNTTVSLQV